MAYESGSGSSLNKAPKLPKQFKPLVPQSKPLTSPALPVNLSNPPSWADFRRQESQVPTVINRPIWTDTQIYALTNTNRTVERDLMDAGVKIVSGTLPSSIPAQWQPSQNRIVYDWTNEPNGVAAMIGNLQEEVVHAATGTVNLPAASRMDARRLSMDRAVTSAARTGNLLAQILVLPFVIGKDGWSWARRNAEGIGNRTGTYLPEAPYWGDYTRDYILSRGTGDR